MLGNTPISDLVITVFVNGSVVRTTPRIQQLEARLSALSELYSAEASQLPIHKRAAAEFSLTLSDQFLRSFCVVGRTTDYVQLIKRIVREFVEETDLKAYFEELCLKDTDFPSRERFACS